MILFANILAKACPLSAQNPIDGGVQCLQTQAAPCNFYGTIYGACNVRYCHPPMAQYPQIVSGTTFSLSIEQPFLAS